MIRTACVTGGAGFIGSHLVGRLLAEGTEVVVLDDFSSGLREHVPPSVRLVEGSVLDDAAIDEATAGCDLVFHLASRVSVPESMAHPDLYHEVTALGTRRVLESALRMGATRLVLASSCSVYGDAPVPVAEDVARSPMSPYAQAKADAEDFCRGFASERFATIAARFFNVYGPGQGADSPYSGVIAKFLQARSEGTTPIVFGDGLQSRDFVFVGDVVNALILAAGSTAPGDGSPFNVGTGQAVSILDLLEAIGCAPADFQPARQGDILHSRADTTRTAEAIGFRAEVSLSEGIRELIG